MRKCLTMKIKKKVDDIDRNQKKQRYINRSSRDTGAFTQRRRLHTWGGVEKRNRETLENEKIEKPDEGNIPKVQQSTKKSSRPGTKTCQKVLPKTKSMIQVRANYINKNNKEIWDKSVERNEESSPVKKKMKNDNEIGKKKENYDKNNKEELIRLSISEKQSKKLDGNGTRKKCIDCNKIYCAKQTSKNRKKCLVCKCGEHGCMKENNYKMSKGDFWICRECKESLESRNILNIPEKPREEIGLKGIKRKRTESESNDHKKVERVETETNPNEKNYCNMKKTTDDTKKDEGSDDSIYLSRYSTTIKESDILLIRGKNWINDNLLTVWMKHLQQIIHGKNEKLLFVLPTITQMLKIGDTKDINKTLNSLEAWWKEYIIMPVNDNSVDKEGGNHWSLLVYSQYDDTWYHFDSLQGSNLKHARRLVSRMNPYLSNKIQPTLVESCCTQQNNNYDCGAFVMVHAKMAARRAIEGKNLDKCYVDKKEITIIREILYDLISLERQMAKTRGNGEKIGKKDEKNDTEERIKIVEKEQIQQKIESVCRNWAKDTCKKGESCIYKHPVRCEEIMRKGYCDNKQYRKCKYYHPKICWDNLNQERCRRGHRCTYRHINREIIGYDNQNSRNSKEQRENDRKYHNKVREIREKEKEWEPQDNGERNDFLWKNIHPWEKEQIIEIWNQKRAERRHRRRWY